MEEQIWPRWGVEIREGGRRRKGNTRGQEHDLWKLCLGMRERNIPY